MENSEQSAAPREARDPQTRDPTSNAGVAEGDSPPQPEAVRGEPAEGWRQRAENAERELALRRALQGVEWFDAEDAYRELAQHARQDATGNWRVTLPAESKFAEAEVLSPADAARVLAQRKPHWVKARVVGGSGAGSGNGNGAVNGGVTYAELLRPENRAKLQEFLYERQDELERLRQDYFRR